MPAWLALFTDMLTGLSNHLQFVAPDNHLPHPPHHSPPPGEQDNEQDGIDVQPPKEDENNNSHKSKRSEKSRSNIKLTRDVDMSEDEGSYVFEHTQCSMGPCLSEVDQLPLTLLDGKGFMYATLWSCPYPSGYRSKGTWRSPRSNYRKGWKSPVVLSLASCLWTSTSWLPSATMWRQ